MIVETHKQAGNWQRKYCRNTGGNLKVQWTTGCFFFLLNFKLNNNPQWESKYDMSIGLELPCLVYIKSTWIQWLWPVSQDSQTSTQNTWNLSYLAASQSSYLLDKLCLLRKLSVDSKACVFGLLCLERVVFECLLVHRLTQNNKKSVLPLHI